MKGNETQHDWDTPCSVLCTQKRVLTSSSMGRSQNFALNTKCIKANYLTFTPSEVVRKPLKRTQKPF